VDIVVATELKLKVLQKAKTVVKLESTGSGMVLRSDRVLYVALPVALVLATAPFTGVYALVAAIGSGVAIGYYVAVDSVHGVKEKVLEQVLQEVRAAEILPDDKLSQVLQRTTTVYTVDNVFRMLCCKRWMLASKSLSMEQENVRSGNVSFYSFDVQDVVQDTTVHCKFRYSNAHALCSQLMSKYPMKTSLLTSVFPWKTLWWSQEQRQNSLWDFLHVLQRDPVLSTTNEVITFLGLGGEPTSLDTTL